MVSERCEGRIAGGAHADGIYAHSASEGSTSKPGVSGPWTCESLPAGGRDHRGVVGAEVERRDHDAEPAEASHDRLAQRPVGRDTADHRDRGRRRCDPPPPRDPPPAGRPPPPGSSPRGRRPPAGRAGHTVLGERARAEVANHVAHRRLQPAEREGAVEPGARQREARGIAGRRDPLDRRAARVLEAEQPRDLVERLAGGVVAGGRQPLGDTVLAEHDALGVAAADQQRQVRRLQVGVGEPGAVHVPGEVRDADDRAARGRSPRRSHTWCRRSGSPARPGPRVTATASMASQPPGTGAERCVDDGGEPLEVRARRQLGNDTAVGRMQGDLRRHHRRTHLAAVGEHRRRGLVAGGLDGQEIQADGYSIEGPPPTPATSRPLRIALKPRLNSGAWMLSLHMITASSPLSV